jgi:hypothetical protein
LFSAVSSGRVALTQITQHAEREFLLRISYMEIYNETLRDLLNPATVVRIRQDKSVRGVSALGVYP